MSTLISSPSVFRANALASLGQLPSFSPILKNLMAGLAGDDVSFSLIAKWIEKDTVLAANVLRLVNSALYGRQSSISSIHHAISILGVNKVRNIVLSLSVSGMWTKVRTPKGFSIARFNLHSAATAVLADMLVQKLPVDYPEGGFVAGLLHDIGKLLIALSAPDQYQASQQLCESGNRTLSECENELIGITHSELSALALEKWQLPEPIRRAVQDHHAQSLDTSRLSTAVKIADAIANRFGISVISSPTLGDPVEPLVSIGLESSVKSILEDFKLEFESIKSFY
jgi:putative nucleotidyltransferase with HDIG domain